MDLSALFAPVSAWMDAHPAAIAWLLGWVAAISAGQATKQLLPPSWSTTRVKRLVQIVAMTVGTAIAFMLWPSDAANAAHAAPASLVCGMSAPTAYTLLKAIIEARFPRLAYYLSWQRVQERNGAGPADSAQGPAP